jgi:uncharacterized membrane protein HdeD (DUF308 family)
MTDHSPASLIGDAMRAEVQEHKTWYSIQAILLIVLGIVALVYPLISTAALALTFGWLMLFGGVAQAISLIGAGKIPYFWMMLISAILAIVVGVLFIRNPDVAVGSLVMLMIVYFMASGITRFVLSLTVRPFPGWGWVMVSGIISVLLSLFLIANPAVAIVTLGVFLGIQLISEGVGTFMLMRD